MVEISPPAEAYFARLLAKEKTPGMNLRISVLEPGTPRADCQLEFCAPGDQQNDDIPYAYDSFSLYVAAASEAWLEDALIDFVSDDTGGQLTIKAPGLKGRAPDADAPLRARVEWLLEHEINPQVASHGGHISLEDVTEDGRVTLRFGGGCQGCGMANVTLKQGVEKTLLERLPEITAVVDITDHEAGANPYYQ